MPIYWILLGDLLVHFFTWSWAPIFIVAQCLIATQKKIVFQNSRILLMRILCLHSDSELMGINKLDYL